MGIIRNTWHFSFALLLATGGQSAYTFRPEDTNVSLAKLHNYPFAYNLSTSQTGHDARSTNGSFWMSSFVHAFDRHDYLIISHVIQGTTLPATYRASILDLSTPSQYSQVALSSPGTNIYSPAGTLNATTDRYGVRAISKTDALAGIQSYSSTPTVKFNLTFTMSSAPILNAGVGMFWVHGGLGYQWSMPAGQTHGSIYVNNSWMAIDPSRSFTWYDRQWGSMPPLFTWFQVHIPSSTKGTDNSRFSIWLCKDSVNGDKSFAAYRKGDLSQQITIPVEVAISSNRTYESAATGGIYPLDWDVQFPTGLRLKLRSIRPDQEIYGHETPLVTYTGFVQVIACHPTSSDEYGFGVVESTMTQNPGA